MKKLLRYLSLYGNCFKIAFRAQTMYRSTYLLGVVGQWIGYGATFLTLYIMVENFVMLGGWNGAEITALYAISLMSYAIAAAFFWRSCNDLAPRIRSGEFDGTLTKPLHPFIQMLFRDGFNMGYVSHFTISLVVLAYGLWASGWQPTLRGMLLLISAVLGASLVQAAALIAASAMAFFTVGDNPAMSIMYDIKDFTHYPITIFPRGIQFVLTFILPFAFINFYPAAMLFGKEIPAGYPAALPYLTPLVGAVLFVLSLCLWNWGLKHYQSTGS